MKVILNKDLETLGDRGDVKEVKAGYARNYLIPRGLAVVASRSALKSLDEQKRVDERKELRIEVELKKRSDAIANTAVEIIARAGVEGRIYGSVTAAQISAALKEKFALEIDKRRVLLDPPIKHIGEHTVNIRLSAGLEVPVRVNVIPEVVEAPPQPEEKPEEAPEPEVAEDEVTPEEEPEAGDDAEDESPAE